MLNLDKNQKYLLACSFGPDSMALFSMLEKEGYNFAVAHVNYHLRKESNQEECELKDYCFRHSIKIYVLEVEKDEYSGNLEACCRKIRYRFFESIVASNEYDAVLTAHHQDDLIETFIMQKQRKSIPDYYGIKKESVINNITIIRPLLSLTKSFLLDYCVKNSIPFSVDKTNLLNTFTRNKIRHSIVEKMTENDRERILLEIDEMNKQKKDLLNKLMSNDLESVEYLNRLNYEELAAAIILSGRAIKSDFECTKKQIYEIKKVLQSSKPNILLSVKGIYFVKRYNRFLPVLDNEQEKSYSFVINKPTILDTEYFFLDFTGDVSNRNVFNDSYPLTIRNALPSDTYKIKNYEKTVRRLFIDWKMPMYLRKRWPLIVDKNNKVIYMPRYRKDFIPDKNCNFYVKF